MRLPDYVPLCVALGRASFHRSQLRLLLLLLPTPMLLCSCAASSQLNELKERAKQQLASILEQYSSSGGGNRSSSSGIGTIDTRALRAKLEAAVRVMQTGLVERDAEVGFKSRARVLL